MVLVNLVLQYLRVTRPRCAPISIVTQRAYDETQELSNRARDTSSIAVLDFISPMFLPVRPAADY